MTVTKDDFDKIWASTSPLTPYQFSESQYKEGWNFVGSTPPARQMWDFLQKNNDEKLQYLANNYLPLSGGTMTGLIQYVNNGKVFAIRNTGTGSVDLGWNWDNREGAGLGLKSTDYSNPGEFILFARDANNASYLTGNPGGSLTWNNKDVEIVNASGTNYIRYESGLQMVFDKIDVSGATSYTKTYTYPVAFVKNPTIVTGKRWAYPNEQITIQNDTTTKFNAYITNSGDNLHNMFFISIGRWK